MKTNTMSTRSTYTTDSFRKVKDEETSKLVVKRWVEERSISVSLVSHEGGVFHNGARIA